jgi:hypothetical protein
MVLGVGSAPAWAMKSSPSVGGTSDCGWHVNRDYGPESLTYRIHLDLGGCAWWDGSDRSVKVTVKRIDEHGSRTARSSPAPCFRTKQLGSGRAGCDASATIPHPEGETARYVGDATWQWNDGPHRVGFDTNCTTTSESVSCADEPNPVG